MMAPPSTPSAISNASFAIASPLSSFLTLFPSLILSSATSPPMEDPLSLSPSPTSSPSSPPRLVPTASTTNGPSSTLSRSSPRIAKTQNSSIVLLASWLICPSRTMPISARVRVLLLLSL
ncbi:hypothetical protein AHAS_Ahas15G0049000 [Arachis hypogaea]